MTRLLEKAIAVVRELPEARQDENANLLLFEVGEKPLLFLTEEENRAVDEGLADAIAGRFATPEALGQGSYSSSPISRKMPSKSRASLKSR